MTNIQQHNCTHTLAFAATSREEVLRVVGIDGGRFIGAVIDSLPRTLGRRLGCSMPWTRGHRMRYRGYAAVRRLDFGFVF